MDLINILLTIAVFALPVLFAITIHEAAHGYAARYFGDNTAAFLGRITLNPLRHIDPLGTILIPALLYLSTAGTFLFGYAKPVPVNFNALRNPKRDMIWVALAGPASNFVQAFAWVIAFHLLRGLSDGGGGAWYSGFFAQMCQAGILVNIVMCVFNLFPLPPLDGGRILVGLLPSRLSSALSRIEPWGFFIVLGLVLTGVINNIWMRPMMQLIQNAIRTLLWLLQLLFKIQF